MVKSPTHANKTLKQTAPSDPYCCYIDNLKRSEINYFSILYSKKSTTFRYLLILVIVNSPNKFKSPDSMDRIIFKCEIL